MNVLVTDLVESFSPIAKSRGYDTHEGSTGRCWDIANEFALHAVEFGTPVEIRRVRSLHSTRAEDDVSNFNVIDGVAVDFASLGGANWLGKDWPVVCPVDSYMVAQGGERIAMCPQCGTTAEPHDDCFGPVPKSVHVDRARMALRESLSSSGILAALSTAVF